MKNAIIVVLTFVICLLLLAVGFLLWLNFFNEKEDQTSQSSSPTEVVQTVPSRVDIYSPSPEESAPPMVSIVDKVDYVWGEQVVYGLTVLVVKNENSFPVRVRDFNAIYKSVQDRTEEEDLFSVVPSILQPGEVGYAVNTGIFTFINFAEDFAGSDIEQDILVADSASYTNLEVSNVSFSVELYNESNDTDGQLKVYGTMTNNSNVNVDGDKIEAIALMYDSDNNLIGALSEILDKSGMRLREGEQFDFAIDSFTLSRDIMDRTHRVDVYAGCATCN
ncbi:hypothetical protein [Paenibacillus agilis]|uniref:Uncharacterized protein n=1 Tax=Paenibacillus agilis TaxID=3020863 RepID=A0A559J031_9BACL|nr:hypothetical protein [Paenibacillus agilis]TVX93236.1 hypothetical protein FPZ44_09310 [Paenibacillus agilis]